MPLSDFTTPLRLTWSMVRQRLPELHPEPSMVRLTTGLTKGSRRPAKSMCRGMAALASTGFFWFSTAISCLGCDFLCAAELLALGATTLAVDAFGLAGLRLARRSTVGWLAGASGCGELGLPELPCEAARAASESIAFFCWTAFIVFFVFSMTSRF